MKKSKKSYFSKTNCMRKICQKNQLKFGQELEEEEKEERGRELM